MESGTCSTVRIVLTRILYRNFLMVQLRLTSLSIVLSCKCILSSTNLRVEATFKTVTNVSMLGPGIRGEDFVRRLSCVSCGIRWDARWRRDEFTVGKGRIGSSDEWRDDDQSLLEASSKFCRGLDGSSKQRGWIYAISNRRTLWGRRISAVGEENHGSLICHS